MSIVTLQLTISFCTKRTKLFRTLEVGIFNSQMQQHGRPSPDHWRRVLVSPKFLNTIHSSKYNSQLQQHRRPSLDHWRSVSACPWTGNQKG